MVQISHQNTFMKLELLYRHKQIVKPIINNSPMN